MSQPMEAEVPQFELGDRLRRSRLAWAARSGEPCEQEDIARKLGVSRVTVSNWETGKYAPADPPRVCRDWADATHTSLAWLYYGEDTPRTRKLAEDMRQALAEQDALMKRMERLRHSDQRRRRNGWTDREPAHAMSSVVNL